MPGTYNPETRTISLQTEFNSEPLLTTATLIHFFVKDLMLQRQFELYQFPEVVDMATIATGLGLPLSFLSFVDSQGGHGMSGWTHRQQPFLDQRSLVYALALTAWIRAEVNPKWAAKLRPDVRGPFKKALKFLAKTNDSFFTAKSNRDSIDSSQATWLNVAKSDYVSKKIIGLRNFMPDDSITAEQTSVLVESLQSRNDWVVINAIWAVETCRNDAAPIVDELRELVDHSNEEVRAKSLTSLGLLGKMDERTIDRAAGMVSCGVPFIEYSAVLALANLESVPENVLEAMNRGLERALQKCNYGFVGLFVSAFDQWFDEPEVHITRLLEEDHPEYLQIALETLEQNRENLVALGG